MSLKTFEKIILSNLKNTKKDLIYKKYEFCPPYTTIAQKKIYLKRK